MHDITMAHRCPPFRLHSTQLTSIQGIKYIYTENIFIYCFLGFAALTCVYVAIRGPDRWKRQKVEDIYAM